VRLQTVSALVAEMLPARTPDELRDSGRHLAAVLVREIVAAGRVSHLAAAA
jgi:hypothetical protein